MNALQKAVLNATPKYLRKKQPRLIKNITPAGDFRPLPAVKQNVSTDFVNEIFAMAFMSIVAAGVVVLWFL